MTGFSYCNEILTFRSFPLPSPAGPVMVWYTIYNAPYTSGPHLTIIHISGYLKILEIAKVISETIFAIFARDSIDYYFIVQMHVCADHAQLFIYPSAYCFLQSKNIYALLN